jgi:hypothetical protein
MKEMICRFFEVAALGAALILLLGIGACFAGEYGRLAAELAGTIKTSGLNRIAISSFSAHGLAGHPAAAEAQRRLSEELFVLPGLGVMDAVVVKKLKERGARWAQVLIKGQVYGTGDGAVLVIKAVSTRSRKQLAILQINIAEAAQSPVPADFRDAPADIKDAACVKSRNQLQEENRAAVDLKARYWAARAREPGFSYSGLAEAPGSELRDYGTLQKFYELFNAYYEQDGPVILTAAERSALTLLMEKEAIVLRDCPAER